MKPVNLVARFVLCLCLVGNSVGGESWIVSEDGAGPVKLGMTIAQLNAVLHEKFSLPDEKDDQGCFYVNPRGHEHIAFMVIDGRVARIDVDGAGVLTSSGIQVGDSEAHVRKVYGPRVRVSPHQYTDTGHYLTVRSADGSYGVRFETDKGKITMFYAGKYDAIQYVEGCE